MRDNFTSRIRLSVRRVLTASGVLLLLAVPGTTPGIRQAQSSEPSYTDRQAARGKAVYDADCAMCHGQNLDDGEFGPALKGDRFRDGWVGKTALELFDYTKRAMPMTAPNSLDAADYAATLAYLLKANDAAPGSSEFPTDALALTAAKLPWSLSRQGQLRAGGPSGGLAPGIPLPTWRTPPSPLARLSPVTDALLTEPPPESWLAWRRTRDDLGFCPLRQITRENVGELRLAWSLALPAGPNESTPLVHDGVMFVHSFGDHVQAIDAATGDELWHYARQLPNGVHATVKRNIAIYDDKVFVGTSDVHVIALEMRTGKLLWDKPLVDPGSHWMLTGGPLVARGKVIQGIVGRGPGGAYLTALDATTGNEVWRFFSIARPGEFGGNSWNGLRLAARNGGSIWTAPSYDADLNLVFFGPAPTYDTGPLLRVRRHADVTNDALFTDSTIAIDPDTGKRVWHYQHVQNDQWDFDWAFERQILEMSLNGRMKKVVITAGKPAVYDLLEADTGHYISSIDLGLQNLIVSIDPKTGRKITDRALYPGDGKTKLICPHVGGAKNWTPASYNPNTHLLYVPLVESCMDLRPVEPGEHGDLTSGVRWTLRPRPDSDGRYGRVQAIDVSTGKTVWTQRQRAPTSTGTLATAGGVVFAGAIDRRLTAYDDATGAILWTVRLNDIPSSAPISYAVDGKQYIAMVVGYGGVQAAVFPALVPEIPLPTVTSSSVWVFALP